MRNPICFMLLRVAFRSQLDPLWDDTCFAASADDAAFSTGASETDTYTMVRIQPEDLYAISNYAIGQLKKPLVLLESCTIKDYSKYGPLRKQSLKAAQDFEIRDGSTPVMGFHSGPGNMWANQQYGEIVTHCERQGWLKIVTSAFKKSTAKSEAPTT